MNGARSNTEMAEAIPAHVDADTAAVAVVALEHAGCARAARMDAVINEKGPLMRAAPETEKEHRMRDHLTPVSQPVQDPRDPRQAPDPATFDMPPAEVGRALRQHAQQAVAALKLEPRFVEIHERNLRRVDLYEALGLLVERHGVSAVHEALITIARGQ